MPYEILSCGGKKNINPPLALANLTLILPPTVYILRASRTSNYLDALSGNIVPKLSQFFIKRKSPVVHEAQKSSNHRGSGPFKPVVRCGQGGIRKGADAPHHVYALLLVYTMHLKKRFPIIYFSCRVIRS